MGEPAPCGVAYTAPGKTRPSLSRLAYAHAFVTTTTDPRSEGHCFPGPDILNRWGRRSS
jgi:hypothetical protein